MTNIEMLSTDTLAEELDAEMTCLTGTRTTKDRKRQIAVTTARVAVELRSRGRLDAKELEDIVTACKPYLPTPVS